MSVPVPPPQWPAIVAAVMQTAWAEDASPKRRKAFLGRLAKGIERHKAGERPIMIDRSAEETALAAAEVATAFAYLEALLPALRVYLRD